VELHLCFAKLESTLQLPTTYSTLLEVSFGGSPLCSKSADPISG